jgi:hypothetical protein
MGIFLSLSSLALQGVVKAACDAAGLQTVGAHVGDVVGFLTQHFTDHSQNLAGALKKANERASVDSGEPWSGQWRGCQAKAPSRE